MGRDLGNFIGGLGAETKRAASKKSPPLLPEKRPSAAPGAQRKPCSPLEFSPRCMQMTPVPKSVYYHCAPDERKGLDLSNVWLILRCLQTWTIPAQLQIVRDSDCAFVYASAGIGWWQLRQSACLCQPKILQDVSTLLEVESSRVPDRSLGTLQPRHL